ncbi:MAG TPA: L,D-transpeptidase family protein [Flavipsychrobacter sp.]|nr:L,D-transpeptidase family protein [Flavipsychrobacter sp.]
MSITVGYGRKRVYVIILILSCFFLLESCNSGQQKGSGIKLFSSSGFVDKDAFSSQLQSVFKKWDTSNHKDQSIADYMMHMYQQNQYKPVWVTNDGVRDAAATFLKELEDVRWDGLDPEHYHLSGLKKMQAQLHDDKHPDINTVITFDTSLTISYLNVARDLLMGAVNPKKADTLWFQKNDTSWDGPHALLSLGSDDKYVSLNDYRSLIPLYKMFRDEYKRYDSLQKNEQLISLIDRIQGIKRITHPDSASRNIITDVIKAEMPWASSEPNDSVSEFAQMVMTYQDYMNIKVSGRLDSFTIARLSAQPAQFATSLKANMERLRWMPREMGNTYIWVDVPLMELFFKREGNLVMHMRVVVGKVSRQTPSLSADMANIIINPSWGVPPTILKKDVLPGLAKSKKYLHKKGLVAYDHSGHEIDASEITATNYKRFVYKQAPGDENALGYVKFNLPNPWDIYLHDTPHRDDFVRRNRFLSSGCIRVQQPQEMALYILSDFEKMKFDQGKLDSMIQTHKSRWEVLKTKIPVHITYLTAFEDTTGNHVRFVRDIYNRDSVLISMLN